MSLNLRKSSLLILGCFGLAFKKARCRFILCCPIKKFGNRVLEIVSGRAPATSSIVRYNQRGPAVLSYVSQFAEPPEEYDVEALAHGAIHSILRLPPNTFSRKLTNSIFFAQGLTLYPFCHIVPQLVIDLLLQRPPI